jgi:mono/diheme cytochrome c family protein
MRILAGLAILAVAAVFGLYALAWRPAIAPITAAAATSFPTGLIAQGESLAAAGNCAACHTAPGGKPFAGGYALVSNFGTIYSVNITPDPQTGIGRWSEEAFVRAMHKGVARDGSQLFPAFPYDHFNRVTAADLHALYAFLMTRTPVTASARANDLPFPLNLRILQAEWKLLNFHDDGVYTPVANKSAAWNRGAYLVEGLAHCGGCHTPRNWLGAEKRGAPTFSGFVIDGWYAPPLNRQSPAPIPWSADELYTYLRSGATVLHGSAFASMSYTIAGLSKLPDSDIHGIAEYFADINGSASASVDVKAVLAKAMAGSGEGTRDPSARGALIFQGACASCHYNSGAMPLLARPELALNTALGAKEPDNLIRVILQGVSIEGGLPGVMMPGFAHSFSDADVAHLTAWLRHSRTEQPEWPNLEARVAAIRKLDQQSALN